MELIKETIKNVLADWQGQKTAAAKSGPQAALKKVFPPKELKHLAFAALRQGIMHLKVDSSSWLYHFNLQKPLRLEKLMRQLPEVKDLRFSLGDTERLKKPGK